MCIRDSNNPLLLQSAGYGQEIKSIEEKKNFTIIYNNYLKVKRKDLLEENEININNNGNEMIYIIAEIESISVPIMIDTGANVSIINHNELDRIQQECHKNLPVLPINNIVLVGATGRQNKTIRKQVSLSVNSCLLYTSAS